MGNILDILIYKPFTWLLITLYDFTNSYALAIILFALVTKIVLLYFSAKGKLGTMRTTRLQPKLQAIQKAYANDKEKLNAETMKLYQTEGVSPMSGCLWMLLPFPVLLMLFNVIREPLTRLMNFQKPTADVTVFLEKLFTEKGIAFTLANKPDPYPELRLAQTVHENFDMVQAATTQTLKDIDFSLFGTSLTQLPQLPWVHLSWIVIIPIISAASAYLSFMVSQKISNAPVNPQMRYMVWMSPAMSLWFGFTMPLAMSVYWIANNLFAMLQDIILTKHYAKVLDAEDAKKAELLARRKAAEDLQKEEDRARRAAMIEAKGGSKNSKKFKMQKNPGKK